MKKWQKRLIIISSSVIVSMLTIYVAGGIAAAYIVCGVAFDTRASDVADLDDVHFAKFQPQYPALQNRKLFTFPSDNEELRGYLYEVSSPKGLVVAVHGITSQADAYHSAYQSYFVEHGYDVLSFDLTGSGRSGGESTKGLHQSAIDVKNCLEYVHNDPAINELPIYMIGHSWGAYGVAAALNFDQSPKAVVAFSGYDSPEEEMFTLAKEAVGGIASLGKWQIDMALRSRSDYSLLRAVDGINKAASTHFLAVQGDQDSIVPYNASIYSKFEEITNEHAERYLLKGYGHSYCWYDEEAYKYITEELEPAYSDFESQHDFNVSSEEKEKFMTTIDYEKSSQLNQELFNKIEQMFEEAK